MGCHGLTFARGFSYPVGYRLLWDNDHMGSHDLSAPQWLVVSHGMVLYAGNHDFFIARVLSSPAGSDLLRDGISRGL